MHQLFISLENVEHDRWKSSNSKRFKSNKNDLPKRIDKNLKPPLSIATTETKNKSEDLQGGGMRYVIISNIIDSWTR